MRSDVIQQARTDLNETVNGRLDMLTSITRASQRVTANPASKPNKRPHSKKLGRKEKLEHVMSDVHLWMQAWSNEGERMFVSVESSDLTSSTTAHVRYIDCSQEQFRTIAASLYQVLHRTTENEPLIIVSSANERTEGVRSLVRNREEVRSEERVRQKISICSTDQQHP